MQGHTSGGSTGAWRVSQRVPPKPYLPVLKDVYPRDEYTRMPAQHGPKYYTGRFITYDFRDEPQQSGTDFLHDRPVVFKSQTIERVQTRKKYGENLKGHSSVPLHLCNDTSSLLYQRSLHPATLESPSAENRAQTDQSGVGQSLSRYPYALHKEVKPPRHLTPLTRYSNIQTWVDTNYPTGRGLATSGSLTLDPSKQGSLRRGFRTRSGPVLRTLEWYEKDFPRQKVADALKFMGTPKPQNQTGCGKELDINFNNKGNN